MHRSLLRNTPWLIRTEYTANNTELGIAIHQKKIWLDFCIHFYQAYKYLRNSQISSRQAQFNSANVVMQQETTEDLNGTETIISSDN